MAKNYKVDDLIYVTITQVKPYAAFFVTDDNVKGMVHVSELSDSFIKDIDKILIPGDVIKVKILKIDDADGFIRASYKQIDDKDKFSSHINIRHGLNEDEKEFEPLARNIQTWIDKTIKRKGLK